MAAHGLYTALSGAIATQTTFEVAANNIANVSTTGYRADRVAFQEQLVSAQGIRDAGNRPVAVSEVLPSDTPGAIRSTDNPLDLAIQGDGFFSVQTPQGIRYTRAGNLVLDRESTLRTQAGHALLDTRNQPIQIPPETRTIRIARDGTVRADEQELGQIRLARFASPRDAVKEGLSLFAAAPGIQPTDATDAVLLQGSLEISNLNGLAGTTELIQTSRAFELFQKLLKTFQETDQKAATTIAKL